ncbi:MAG: hypothetical protein U0Q18_21755 [Bryobacteraceae bacterium]
MAFCATQPGVTPLQQIACGFVIELIFRCGPLEYLEILAIVLGVATGTILIALCPIRHSPVVAFVLSDQVTDFLVTRQAVQLRDARPEGVTTTAFQRAIQRVMGPR